MTVEIRGNKLCIEIDLENARRQRGNRTLPQLGQHARF